MATQTMTPEAKPVPGTPVKETLEVKKRTYILHYRYGNVPHLTKVFEHYGDLDSAVKRGRKHCAEMNYICIFVRPFIVDLDDQEARKRSNPSEWDELENVTFRR